MKPTILVVCTTERDKRELAQATIQSKYSIIFDQHDDTVMESLAQKGEDWLIQYPDHYSFIHNPQQTLDQLIAICQKNKVNGVLSSDDYPGSIFASIVAQKLNLPGPCPNTVLLCQHKYYGRLAQQKYIPYATPHFNLIDPQQEIKNVSISFPVFIKPAKSFFSVFAQSIQSKDQLQEEVKKSVFPSIFLRQFNWFLQGYSSYALNAHHVLVEEKLTGWQVTLEGYVFNHEVVILGITDSIMFPGTICFQRFEYPSQLPDAVQQRMADITVTFLNNIGFNHGFFNIEYMYNEQTDQIHIIEINPRMVSQFADLYEKVDGINSYALLADLAVGKKPHYIPRNGMYAVAASFVLRIFEDYRVVSIPTQHAIDAIYTEFPDARVQIFVQIGQRLSDAFQDGKSYRYGLVHLGARDRQELYEKFEQCKRKLVFKFLS
jgi:biotin carboxylase